MQKLQIHRKRSEARTHPNQKSTIFMFHLYLPDKRRLEAERNGNDDDCAEGQTPKKSLSVWRRGSSGSQLSSIQGERAVADDRDDGYSSRGLATTAQASGDTVAVGGNGSSDVPLFHTHRCFFSFGLRRRTRFQAEVKSGGLAGSRSERRT